MAKNMNFAGAPRQGQPSFRPMVSTAMAQKLSRRADCVDADFETLPLMAGPHVEKKPMRYAQPRFEAARDRSLYFETVQEKSWLPWSGEPLSAPAFYCLAVAIMVVSFWVSGGHQLFMAPPPKSAVIVADQTLPLKVQRVNWDVRFRASKPILFVHGIVENANAQSNLPQDLAIVAHYPDGGTEKLFIKGHGKVLAPFEDYQFHGQLDLTRPEIASVSVEFQKP